MSSFAGFQLKAAALIALVYLGFVFWMLDGWTLTPRSPEALGVFMLAAFVAGALGFGGLWVAHMRHDGPRSLADEREASIEAAADRDAARVTDGALFFLVISALSDAKWGWMGSFALTRLEGLVFALFSISALAGLVRFAAGYRRAQRS